MLIPICLLLAICVYQDEARKLPSAPRKVTARVIPPNDIEVAWRDPDLRVLGRVPSERLYVVKYGPLKTNQQTVRSKRRKVRLLGVQINATYDIAVKSITIADNISSPWSKTISLTILPVSEDPNSVRNLTATPISSDAILLSWQPPLQAQQVLSYTVIFHPANGKGRKRKATVSREVTFYEAKELHPNIIYSFQIQTMMLIQANKSHPPSSSVHAKTFSGIPSSAPRMLNLQMIDPTIVQVKWLPPAPRTRNGDITGYTLQYKQEESKKGEVHTVTAEASVRAFNLTDILSNEIYRVRLAANTVNGTGPFTKWASIFVVPKTYPENVTTTNNNFDVTLSTPRPATLNHLPSSPFEVKIVNKTGSNVHLTWPVPAVPKCCPVVAYRINIHNFNDSTNAEIIRETHHVHLDGLDPETLYGVNITALNAAGESEPSKELVFVTPAAVPPSILYYQATNVNVGGNANVTCKAGGHELPTIEWSIKTMEGNISLSQIEMSSGVFAETLTVTSHQDSPDSVSSSLLLYKVTPATQREIICKAKNRAGEAQGLIRLAINEPPRILSAHGVTVMVSSPGRMVCEAYGRPVPEIIWIHMEYNTVYKEGISNDRDGTGVTSVIDDANSVIQSSLLINGSRLADRGTYSCVARSQAGRAEANVILDVKVPPPPPVTKIQTIPLSPTRLSVNWLPPLNYNFTIVYYQVSYRKKGESQSSVINATRVGTELYDLDQKTEYLVGVTAGTDDSLGEPGPEVKVTTLTNEGLEPANMSAKTLNSTVIQLDWEAPDNVSPMYIRGFNIYYKTEGDTRAEKVFVRGSRNKQLLIGSGQNATYYLRISTLMTWGFEAHSNWIRIQKHSTSFLPPAKISSGNAVAKQEKITLTWQAVEFAKGYKIVYGPLTDPLNVRRATVAADVKEFDIDDLLPSTKYVVSIRAYNEAGDAEPLYIRTATQAYPPSMVKHAKALVISSTKIHVQWEPPERGHVTRYHIRYWRPGHKDKQSAWLSGSSLNYVAGSLKKFSNYRFEIIPYDGALLGEGIVMFAQTFSDKPDGPPKDVQIQPINSTALLATWSPPDPDEVNGVITGYKLILRERDGQRLASFRVSKLMTNFTFLNMSTSKPYTFRIAAMTINGTGLYSPWVESTFPAVPTRPDPPESLTAVATEHSLTLHWREPPLRGFPLHGYVVGYGQFIPEVYRKILGPSQMSYTIKSLKPDSEYIISVRAFNQIGESSPTFILARTKEVPVQPLAFLTPVKLTVQAESESSLKLTWSDPAISNSQRAMDGRAYLIRYSPLSGEAYSYINTSDQVLVLTNLEPGTQYEVSIKAVKGTNSSQWSLPVVNSTQEIAPRSAPENIVASRHPIQLNYILLSWTEPKTPNGIIEEYIIYLTPNPTLDTKLWVVMKTKRREAKIGVITPHTIYYFKLQAMNKAGYGPLSKTVVYNPPTDKRAAPSMVRIQGIHYKDSTTVKVVWTVPEISLDQIIGYIVLFTDDVNNENADWLGQSETGLESSIAGLHYNTTYYFKVQAHYVAGYGPYSNIVTYSTPVRAPKTFEGSSSTLVNQTTPGTLTRVNYSKHIKFTLSTAADTLSTDHNDDPPTNTIKSTLSTGEDTLTTSHKDDPPTNTISEQFITTTSINQHVSLQPDPFSSHGKYFENRGQVHVANQSSLEEVTVLPLEDDRVLPLEDGRNLPPEDGRDLPLEDGRDLPLEDGRDLPLEDDMDLNPFYGWEEGSGVGKNDSVYYEKNNIVGVVSVSGQVSHSYNASVDDVDRNEQLTERQDDLTDGVTKDNTVSLLHDYFDQDNIDNSNNFNNFTEQL
ncbi:unnamed protein product [Lymnaea stagnalis]|uniref:Uncharacterized protein n=1 Tax=Lymnaea stagnalis TaxID=6523 RepID=A0AAV2I0Y3_LYMST